MIKETKQQIQKLPLSKKGQDWRESNVDYVISVTGRSAAEKRTKNMEENLSLYLGEFDKKRIEYVLSPYGVKQGFPALPHNINIIKPKVDRLIGEEIVSPVKARVVCTSGKSSEQVNQNIIESVTSYMAKLALSNLSEEGQAKLQEAMRSGEITDPREAILGDQMTGEPTYKSLIEEDARAMTEYLYEKLSLKDHIPAMLFDMLTSSEEAMYIGVNGDNVFAERVDPREIGSIPSSSSTSGLFERLEDSEMICRVSYMTPSELYDRLYHIADESTLNAIIDKADGKPTSLKKGISMSDTIKDVNVVALNQNGEVGKLPLYHVLWRSFKKIGFLSYLDEDGNQVNTIVSEGYKETGSEISLEWDWIPEIWEGYRVGDDIYVGINPLEFQNTNSDNILDQKMPYFGVKAIGGYSLVDILKPLQYLYIIFWYRLELAIARDKGTILNMDVTKIPKSQGVTTEEWLHMIESVGINFYNPYESNREENPIERINSSPTGITVSDLSSSRAIAEYRNILAQIEALAESLSGISKQRLGNVKSGEYVGSIQQSVDQSTMTTEPIFWAHESCKEKALRYMLNLSKELYRESGKRFLSFIRSDGAAAAVNLSEDFFYEDYDVFVSNSRTEVKNVEFLKTLYQPAMQNGATLVDIASIVSIDSVEGIRAELAKIQARVDRANANRAQKEQEMEEEKNRIEADKAEREYEIESKKLELARYKIDADNQARISVAELAALGYSGRFNDEQDDELISEAADKAMEIARKNSELKLKALKEDNRASEEKKRLQIEEAKLEEAKSSKAAKLALDEKKFDLEKKKVGMESRKNESK